MPASSGSSNPPSGGRPTPGRPLLLVKNLRVKREERLVLNGVSLVLHQGEKICIIGPNGSGKTTLLETLLGFLPFEGEITFMGKSLRKEKDFAQARKKIGYVFQDPDDQLFCPTVYDEIAFGPLNMKVPKERIPEIVNRCLSIFNAEHLRDKYTYRLSGGEKRIVSVACVLATDPTLLLLDEPTSGLDPERTERILGFLKETDKAVILVTHSREVVESLNWRCYLLNHGNLSQLK